MGIIVTSFIFYSLILSEISEVKLETSKNLRSKQADSGFLNEILAIALLSFRCLENNNNIRITKYKQ